MSHRYADIFVLAVAALLIFVNPAVLSGTVSARGWTPETMISFKSIGSTAISPDGSLVAYTVSEPLFEGEKSEYLTHIRIAASDGTFERQFTFGESSCRTPSFSNDGRLLAFESSRDGGMNQVWIMAVDGGEAYRATSAERGVREYAWSPDGSRIAYTMTDPVTENEERAKLEKRDMRVLDENFKYAHLYVVTVRKSSGDIPEALRLTSGPFHITAFDWSPDGDTIVFAHQETPSADVWSTTDISCIPAGGGKVKPLVTRPGADRYPKYSPDGKWIAFPSDAEDPHWSLLSDVYVIPAEGGESRKLAETPDRNFMYYGRFLGWSADSNEIFVQEVDRTSWRVYAVPFDGSKPRAVTTGPGNFTDVSFSANGRLMAFVHEETDTPPNVFISDIRRFEPVRLTDVNAGYPSFPLGKTVVITWKSTDGLEIEGLLTYPVGYTKERRYPLILYIHGGPANVHTESYTAEANKYPIQAFAQSGYAVLRVNPRGSSGYGKEFRYANHNDWGFGDYDDQMTGVDEVIGMGIAHPDSLCVTGWSYGGYMTALVVTRTDRFKAAVMGAGISNLVSFTGTADIPSFIPDYFGGEPWERTDTYLKHSALFRVGDVTTPTLILHGELDRRVPLSQGEEFYNALRSQGCKTKMVVYPRTYHSPSEPKFIVDVGERIIGWFDSCLGRKSENH